MRQASMTSKEYFIHAQETLENSGLPFTAADVVALARVSAMDFHSVMLSNGIDQLIEKLEAAE
jgi:hypothetical protein